jgi:putative membrane protein
MKTERFLKQFNWRFLLVRIVVNALALAFTAAILPKIYFVDKSIWNWLLMALLLGVLNALLKPVLHFLTLQFIFVTYGLVVILINALLLGLLSLLVPNRFAVESLPWLLVGGLVLGLVSSFFESLLGLTMPVVPDQPPELRQQVEEKGRQAYWLAQASSTTTPAQLALVNEPPTADPEAIAPSRPEPDQELHPPDTADDQAETIENADKVKTKPAPGPQEEFEEDRP